MEQRKKNNGTSTGDDKNGRNESEINAFGEK